MNRISYSGFLILLLFIQSLLFAQENLGWIQQNSHTNRYLNDVFFVNADTGWVVGDYGTILKTTDSGEHWNIQTSNTTANLISVFFTNLNKGWLVGENSTILYTNNCGENWNSQSVDMANASLKDVFFVNDSIGWIANYSPNSTNNSLYKTTDGGAHWFGQNINWSRFPGINTLFFLNENLGWVANHGNGFGITRDGGNSWSILEDDNYQINSMCFVNESLGWTNNSPNGVYKTTDGGNTWFNLNYQPIGWGIDVHFINETTGWATGGIGMDSSVVMQTLDGGNSWSIQLKYPLSNTTFVSLYFIDNNVGWVVGSGGTIFKTTSGGVTSVDEKRINYTSPYNFKLYQNYPNPFNPSTTIRFSLPKSGLVTIEIYNLLGQKLETLLDEYQTAGEHQLQWKPEDLPSGIYVVRLQTGKFSETKKLVFLR